MSDAENLVWVSQHHALAAYWSARLGTGTADAPTSHMISEVVPTEKLSLGSVPTNSVCYSPARFARAALTHPLPVVFAAVGVVIGVGLQSAGVILATLCGHLFLVVLVSRTRSLRQAVATEEAEAARVRVQQEREVRLLEADVEDRRCCEQLAGLVTETEARDARLAQSFELQRWLDRLIDLAVTHRRCVLALEPQEGERISEQLLRAPAAPLAERERERRLEIVRRRAQLWHECEVRAARLREEFESVAELIRLVCQRTSLPPATVGLDEELHIQLLQLDEIERFLDEENRALG
jgi:hypothetical protein